MFRGPLNLKNGNFFLTGLLFAALYLSSAAAAEPPSGGLSPTPTGLWKTIDDKSHKTRGLIRLFEKNGAIFGRIEASEDPKEAAEVCDKCGGERKNKPIIGLEVLQDMRKNGSSYEGGSILDPETGWVYKCRMSLEDGGRKLVVRGYLGFALLGRTQTWLRQE